MILTPRMKKLKLRKCEVMVAQSGLKTKLA